MATTRRTSLSRSAAIVIPMLALVVGVSAQVSEQVLYSFAALNGSNPQGGLLEDFRGNLYGTTLSGGLGDCAKIGCGTVYELLIEGFNRWKFRRLYSFAGGEDGVAPYGSLIFDAGNLYGTTSEGGAHNQGTVFKLALGGNGVWTESVLYSFDIDSGDGGFPYSGVTMDAAGNLYGTTSAGGTQDNGTVYELTPNADGSWSETVLYRFLGGFTDGAGPHAGVTFDSAGNLYGVTVGGGRTHNGTVFELSPTSSGWTEKVLFSFLGKDLANPEAPVWFDEAGNLYGTTCGEYASEGTFFELVNSSGAWTEKTLHTFGGVGDGSCPDSTVIVGGQGNFYGTTAAGGANGDGTFYKVENLADGTWGEKVVYSFAGGSDGSSPLGGVVRGAKGFFGVTASGGTSNDGVIYAVQVYGRKSSGQAITASSTK